MTRPDAIQADWPTWPDVAVAVSLIVGVTPHAHDQAHDHDHDQDHVPAVRLVDNDPERHLAQRL